MAENVAKDQLSGILLKVVDEYLAALEVGEDPNISQIAERYPAHADKITKTLGLLQTLQELKSEDLSSAEVEKPRRVIGDFELIREIGRGGMGIVYEAFQSSVNRRVALKVLPFAAMVDPVRLQRFKNEVRAAGSLHHTNIVPVFSVGLEQGFHYFAMQFIDGMSLAQVISELRRSTISDPGKFETDASQAPSRKSVASSHSPTSKSTFALQRSDEEEQKENQTQREIQAQISTVQSLASVELQRTIARWGTQVADALAFAHQNGVLHRDVKPGNLLLDVNGRVWVADFGLARIQRETGLTLTGDTLGTLRYMAPEQLGARRESIDHRADIYALGATLYELLCLRTVFGAEDRERLLKQVLTEEPVALRKINKKIAPELQTIVLKSLEKEPGDRFESAEELRDELQRFLDQTPIKCRPPAAREMLVKWFRRHPALAATATASLCLLLLVSGGFLIALRSQQQETAVALERAEREGDRANNALQLAITALDDFFGEIGEQWIDEDRGLSEFQLKTLNQAAELLPMIAKNYPQGSTFEWNAGLAYKRAGNALTRLRRFDEAKTHYREAELLLIQALDDSPQRHKILNELAGIDYRVGKLLSTQGSFDSADAKFAAARELWQELAGYSIDDEQNMSLYQALAACCALEQLQTNAFRLRDGEMLEQFDVLLNELKPYRSAGGWTYPNVFELPLQLMRLKSEALRRLGRAEEAKAVCNLNQVALTLYKRLDERSNRRALAAVQAELANCHFELGEFAEAKENANEALSKVRQTFLFDGTPRDKHLSPAGWNSGRHVEEPAAFALYARIQSLLARLEAVAGNAAQAEELLFESTATCHTEFMMTGGTMPGYAQDQLYCCLALGNLDLSSRRVLQILESCISSIDAVAQSEEFTLLHRSDLSVVYALTGKYWLAKRRFGKAATFIQRALLIQQEVQQEASDHPLVGKRIAMIQDLVKVLEELPENYRDSESATLAPIDKFVQDDNRHGLSSPWSITLGPDFDGNGRAEHLFVVDGSNSAVLRFEAVDGLRGDVFIERGWGGLQAAYTARFGPDRNLYVVDTATRAILRFDGEHGQPLGVASAPVDVPATFVAPGAGGMGEPGYIAFDPQGDLYVSGSTTVDGSRRSTIFKFCGPASPTPGQPVGVFADPGNQASFLTYLAFGTDRHLYVADKNSHSVLRFDGTTGEPRPASGNSNADFISPGMGGLQSPWTFRCFDVNGDASDELLVTSQSNEILAFAGDTGVFLGVYATAAETPYDLEFRWDGKLLLGTVAKGGGNVFLFGARNR